MNPAFYLERGGVEPESQGGKSSIIQQDRTSHLTEVSLFNTFPHMTDQSLGIFLSCSRAPSIHYLNFVLKRRKKREESFYETDESAAVTSPTAEKNSLVQYMQSE